MKDDEDDFYNLKEWPVDELEYIKLCPVCHCKQRKMIHDDLMDNIFNSAPGKWVLYECEECRSAYISPRPDRDSIHKAYNDYYTHSDSKQSDDYEQLTLVAKIKRILANGYRNWRYGGQAQPSNKLGVIVMYMFPWLRHEIDQLHRHLPKLNKNRNRILDVGFGNGSFLERVNSIGWKTIGVDFDKEVVASAKKRGLDVHLGGIDVLKEKESYFDVITLSHVIEHLYDPIETLKACYKLLKPGGMIWLETPNILSYGHEVYGKNWRGLETPRHLILFNYNSLKHALDKAGFEKVSVKKRPSAINSMFNQSEIDNKNHFLFGAKVVFFQCLEFIFFDKNELITMQAEKPISKI